MSRLLCCIIVVVIYVSLTSAQYYQDAKDIENIQEIPSAYAYHLVPTNEYAIVEVNPSFNSFWDYISNPVTALAVVGNNALACIKWIVFNGSVVLIGAALVFGFCGLTHYCTITLNNPTINYGYRTLMESNALEQIHGFVHNAIEKYRSFQT